jgi:CubicO group peptidase (beta-lactamase class C family)
MPTFSAVFDYLRDLVATNRLPSAVFGVANKDNVLALDAFGTWPDGRTINVDDAYLLWSVTKPITGLAMAQLWERGLLNPALEVKHYLPWFGTLRTDKVQVWHLLTHTAGISELTLSPANDKRAYLQSAGLDFRAGAFKKYSNQAFTALEEILLAQTGRSLESHLQDNIFQPLGMQHTSFDLYERDPGGFVPMQGLDRAAIDYERFLTLKHPAAGLFSSAPDLLKLGQCLLSNGRHARGSIISRNTLQEMTRPQTSGIASLLPDDWTADGDFGLTWIIPSYSKMLINKRCYGHNGWGGCRFWIYPDEGLVFALMTNHLDTSVFNVNLEVVHNLFTSCL